MESEVQIREEKEKIGVDLHRTKNKRKSVSLHEGILMRFNYYFLEEEEEEGEELAAQRE